MDLKDDVKDEKKPPVEQPPAPAKDAPPKENATGLDLIAKDPQKLRDLYKNSPTLFAGVEEEIKEKTKKEGKEKPPDQKPQSAAPAAKVAKYRDADIKLPPEEKFEKQIGPYLTHWAEQGWSPEQVQKEVDFMAEQDKRASESRSQQKSPAEIAKEEDEKNVAILKADPVFGKNFDKNMAIARGAAAKYFTKETLSRMTTSDPVLVRQAWEFGKLDAEDTTPTGGHPRTGNETEEEERGKRESKDTGLRGRYKNSPTMRFE